MTINLQHRSFLTLLDFSAQEIRYLLDLAHQLKQQRKLGVRGNSLAGKNIALLFEKPSTRTRCAFEIAIVEEGGYPSFIDVLSSQFGYKESIADSAKVFAAYYHGIQYRGYAQKTVEELAKHAGIPVYNGLTDEDHPTQILADLMTIEEHLPTKPLNQVKIAYVGDARNNIANAWMYGCAVMGMQFVAYAPQSLHPSAAALKQAQSRAAQSGAIIEISSDINCLIGADVIYTDVWVSMGEEAQMSNRVKLLKDYQVTMQLLKHSNNPNILFMHCLPAFHDQQTKFVSQAQQKFGLDVREVTEEVFHSRHSVVFSEAENRLHTIKAILVATLSTSQPSLKACS